MAWHPLYDVLTGAIHPEERRKSLRVALLSLVEPASGAGPQLRAFLRIGGVSIARQQVALALALQCERIVCLANAIGREIQELQDQAVRGGAQFHVISGARPLVGIVTATDELIVLADGLFASSEEAWNLLVEGQAVLVQPIEQGLAAGFERIDLNHASAGAMRLPGRLAAQLADLPADCDPVSALTRIALQSGIRQRQIPPPGQDGFFWTLVRGDAEAHAIEPQWVRQRTMDATGMGPARGVALVAVRALGPALLHAGTGANVVVAAALVTAAIAVGFGWFGLESIGFALCAFGWILRECAALIARIEVDFVAPRKGFDNLRLFGWLIDLILIALLTWNGAEIGGRPWPERMFAPIMMVAFLRVLAALPSGRLVGWLTDRSLIALALMAATLGGYGGLAAPIGALVSACAALALLGGTKQLTRP